mmetsp:Transcript_35654/g.93198  ORF Transcript_35654/g.93198 Transcript_35654/m.93198 type:complete len:218 (+) Transcript_35654:1167-1820(+)
MSLSSINSKMTIRAFSLSSISSAELRCLDRFKHRSQYFASKSGECMLGPPALPIVIGRLTTARHPASRAVMNCNSPSKASLINLQNFSYMSDSFSAYWIGIVEEDAASSVLTSNVRHAITCFSIAFFSGSIHTRFIRPCANRSDGRYSDSRLLRNSASIISRWLRMKHSFSTLSSGPADDLCKIFEERTTSSLSRWSAEIKYSAGDFVSTNWLDSRV